MYVNGEFQVGQSDMLKVRAIQLGIPMFDQVPLKELLPEGAVVIVLDGKGDPIGTPVFVNAETGKAVGEPVMLAVQDQKIGVSFTNGLGFVNMIQGDQLPAAEIPKVVPELAAPITASAGPTLASTTEGGWSKQGSLDDFAASASGITPGSLDLPTDPDTHEEIAGTWSFWPSVGSVKTVKVKQGDDLVDQLVATVGLKFVPEDSKYATLLIEVPVSTNTTDNRSIGVTPVTEWKQLVDANENGIKLEVSEAQLSLGMTVTGGTPSVSTTTVTQTLTVTEGTPVLVSEDVIQNQLGYTGLTGSRALIATLLDIPEGTVSLQIVDTASGGIGLDLDRTVILTDKNILSGKVLHLITPVQKTNNDVVLRTISFLDSEGTAIQTQALTIDASAVLA
jgi:hypothetical protein